MKIIGMILTWNNLHFFKCVLKQALSFCDEVIVVDGCHLPSYPKHSKDGTIEYIESMRGHPKLRIIDDFNFKGRNDIVQCKIRSTYSKQSEYWKPGNWVCQFDDDVAFFNEDLMKIKDAMLSTDKDVLRFRERRFAFNFRFNLLADKNNLYGVHFDKIKEGCYYTPTWKMHNKDGSLYKNKLDLVDVIYFHYPYVKTKRRAEFRWAISSNKNVKTRGVVDIWNKFSWKKDEDIFKRRKEFMRVVGGKGKLNIYNGDHPEVMKDHPWMYLNDTRLVKSGF